MNLSKRFLRSIFIIFALAGCRVGPVVPGDNVQAVVDHHIELATEQIRRSQVKPNRAEESNHLLSSIDSAREYTNETISVSWQGDGLPLLKSLAAKRGLGFAAIGPRLPLPVSVHADKVAFESLLEELRAQTVGRASIDATAATLTLEYVRVQQ